ncbi:MAG: LysR family transcriptional regulator [Gammaproteobacteria bacterium]|nr:LysR family transcriptional regulator [Gammaproteobacteria bacterium]
MARKTAYYSQNALQQLRGFVYTARLGSISKAAEQMELSQPSVSLQIQALEKEVGSVLFERRGRKIQLTPEGTQLLEIAQPLVKGFEGLKEDFQARCENLESGELHIAAGESTLLYLLPDFVSRFAEQYPQIQLNFHNVTGRDGLQMLRDDEADFAVGPMSEVPDDIKYEPLYGYPHYLIAPKGHPITFEENIDLETIASYGLILPPRHLSTWRLVKEAFERNKVPFNVKLEVGGWEVIKKYVELGMGISIVSGICLKPWDRLFRYGLPDYFNERSYGVVTRRGKFLSNQAKRFIEILRPGL